MAIAAPVEAYPRTTAANDQARPLFEPGDEVRMRTEMKTFMVASVEVDEVVCEWLDANDEHHSWAFDPRMLVLVRSAP